MKRLLLVLAALLPLETGAAVISIQNADPAGVGFNDATPATPIGGNSGTTLGEQRLIAFRRAADIWAATLQSEVEIVVRAEFQPIRNSGTCTATTAVLGAARAFATVSDFPNAPLTRVRYPVALANKFAGRDLFQNDPDIEAFFNSDVDSQTCLGTRDWYYGLDANNGDDVDLVVVLLHEFAHGLGMSGSFNLTTGVLQGGTPNVFELNTLDLSNGLRLDQMTNAQRKTAAVNNTQTVWIGPATREAALKVLQIATVLAITSPSEIARTYDINTAAFGPPPSSIPIAARIVAGVDAANTEGPATTDGCTAFTNATELAGQIALVDRGTCTFVQKAINAQAAGAIALVVGNNAACGLPPMGGDDATVRIPAIGITKTDADSIRAKTSGGVDAAFRLDPAARSGSSAAGYLRLYTPCELEQGSSMFHWDITATPNLLMEPFVNDDLPHTLDVSALQLLDIGWTLPPRTDAEPSGRRVLRRGGR